MYLLYEAYGQRQVSTIYRTRQQYHVIMEVAPQYWQDPETLRDIFVSKAGGNATGTQTTNAVAGTVSGPPTVSSSSAGATAAAVAAERSAQPCSQLYRQYREGSSINRIGGKHECRAYDAAECRSPLLSRQYPACRQSPGSVRRHDNVFQPSNRHLP
jgi:hypothetical protein